MAFDIPNFSDAKKHQEHLDPTTSFRHGTVPSPKNATEKPTIPKGNPYAKRKHPSATETTLHDNSGRSYLNEPISSESHKNSRQYTNNYASIVPTPANATFSQAFINIEESVHYETQNKVSTTSTKSLLNKPIVEDVPTSAAQTLFDEPTSDTITSARENHIYLQTHVLHVSTRQRGNGILRYIRNVPYEYSEIVPDFIMSPNRCSLFLSFKYHCLHPNYIHRRISELRMDFDLRVLLCLVDVDDNATILFGLNKLCVVNNMTLVLAWSEEEAARYLETFKAFEGKDASLIQKREQTNFPDQITDVLTSIKSVNKTDAAQLLGHFGSLKGIISASIDQLGLVAGLGPKKVRRLHDAFHKPFSSLAARKRREESEQKRLAEEENQNGLLDQHKILESDTDLNNEIRIDEREQNTIANVGRMSSPVILSEAATTENVQGNLII